ncbi:formin-like protein 5 isoform X1 [Iris pallida]|uniref:Formin-like protein 5 isoform X1 n=1 Tax=Iris pallida TaxID=29817 RepID=A0AAX6DPD5_IRIPA|nr:formin-like protein 5 isoform X1 [Iris pallida]
MGKHGRPWPTGARGSDPQRWLSPMVLLELVGRRAVQAPSVTRRAAPTRGKRTAAGTRLDNGSSDAVHRRWRAEGGRSSTRSAALHQSGARAAEGWARPREDLDQATPAALDTGSGNLDAVLAWLCYRARRSPLAAVARLRRNATLSSTPETEATRHFGSYETPAAWHGGEGFRLGSFG